MLYSIALYLYGLVIVIRNLGVHKVGLDNHVDLI